MNHIVTYPVALLIPALILLAVYYQHCIMDYYLMIKKRNIEGVVGYRQVRDDPWSHYYFPGFKALYPIPNVL